MLPDKVRPPTLAEYLERCEQIDLGLIKATVEEMDKLGELIELKVDGYASLMGRCESEMARFDSRIKSFKEVRDQLSRMHERAESLLIRAMQSQNKTRIDGQDFVAIIKRNPPGTTLSTKYPTMDQVIEHPEFTRAKYEWNKTALKSAIESGSEAASQIAKIEQGVTLSFEPRKGITDGK